MSKIKAKPFDPSRNVIRSVFRGAPNLLTSSDVNRQIEALKWQIDNVERVAGIYGENVKLSCSSIKSLEDKLSFSVSIGWDKLRARGIEFPELSQRDIVIEESFANDEDGLRRTSWGSAGALFLGFTYKERTITFESNSDSDLVRADFEDGSTKGGADQILLDAGDYDFRFYHPREVPEKCILVGTLYWHISRKKPAELVFYGEQFGKADVPQVTTDEATKDFPIGSTITDIAKKMTGYMRPFATSSNYGYNKIQPNTAFVRADAPLGGVQAVGRVIHTFLQPFKLYITEQNRTLINTGFVEIGYIISDELRDYVNSIPRELMLDVQSPRSLGVVSGKFLNDTQVLMYDFGIEALTDITVENKVNLSGETTTYKPKYRVGLFYGLQSISPDFKVAFYDQSISNSTLEKSSIPSSQVNKTIEVPIRKLGSFTI